MTSIDCRWPEVDRTYRRFATMEKPEFPSFCHGNLNNLAPHPLTAITISGRSIRRHAMPLLTEIDFRRPEVDRTDGRWATMEDLFSCFWQGVHEKLTTHPLTDDTFSGRDYVITRCPLLTGINIGVYPEAIDGTDCRWAAGKLNLLNFRARWHENLFPVGMYGVTLLTFLTGVDRRRHEVDQTDVAERQWQSLDFHAYVLLGQHYFGVRWLWDILHQVCEVYSVTRCRLLTGIDCRRPHVGRIKSRWAERRWKTSFPMYLARSTWKTDTSWPSLSGREETSFFRYSHCRRCVTFRHQRDVFNCIRDDSCKRTKRLMRPFVFDKTAARFRIKETYNHIYVPLYLCRLYSSGRVIATWQRMRNC